MRLSQAVAGHGSRFRSLLGDPRTVQEGVLARLLSDNASTAWGRRHGLEGIRAPAQYAGEVPVSAWEDLKPWIDRAAAGEPGVLTREPVLAFEETGGSSGGSKLIPYTASALAGFQRGLLPWLDDLFQAHPGLGEGRFYWAISPACRAPKVTAGGIPVGLPGDAAYFGEELAPLIVEGLAVPPEVGAIADFSPWRDATLGHLLSCAGLTMISVWSPTFLTELLRFAGEHDYKRIWPDLKVISCWDQAGAKPQAAELRRLFPGVRVQGKGLLATEGLVSLPLCGFDHPVLALESGYWEFIDAAGHAHPAHEVREGEQYQLVISTASGFFRYALGDRVRIPGFAGRTPLIEFVGRGDAASDLCGEKLTDAFVAGVLAPLHLRFVQLCPVPGGPGYALLLDEQEVPPGNLEALLQRVEDGLAANPQYAYARRLGQLATLTALRVQRPLERWIARGLANGQRLGDIKLPALAPAWAGDFA